MKAKKNLSKKEKIGKNKMCTKLEKLSNNKGITLVALVVTVIILLILAGITISSITGDRSIVNDAKDARNSVEHIMDETLEDLAKLSNELKEEYSNSGNTGENGGTTNPPDVPAEPKGPNGKPLVSNVTDTNHKTTIVEDKHGNEITVPQGFKVVAGSTGEEITVQNGVVIEDSDGNQFVWIPVGVVTKNDGTKSEEIKLGRYTFATSDPGKPTLAANSYQYAYTDENPTNYTNTVTIQSYYQELSTARDGSSSLNATAKDLAGFVESVKANGGYYLARYEASYGSGYNEEGSTDSAKYGSAKPLSKPSTANAWNMNYTPRTLWNNITQLNASIVARNMYAGNKDINGNTVGVESDLVNSYAWDTAIVYITEMDNANFANKKYSDVGSTSLANTGSNSSDKFCNVYDMVANTYEWTTEYYSTLSGLPCTVRGGGYNSSGRCTAYRYYGKTSNSTGGITFRLSLYIK